MKKSELKQLIKECLQESNEPSNTAEEIGLTLKDELTSSMPNSEKLKLISLELAKLGFNKKQISSIMGYDEDFIPDTFSAAKFYKQQNQTGAIGEIYKGEQWKSSCCWARPVGELDPEHQGRCSKCKEMTDFELDTPQNRGEVDESNDIENEGIKDVVKDVVNFFKRLSTRQIKNFLLKISGKKPRPAFDISKLEDIEIDGVDARDFPDFSDAYITSASYNGKPLNDTELDKLNMDYPEIANELAHESMQGASDSYRDYYEER